MTFQSFRRRIRILVIDITELVTTVELSPLRRLVIFKRLDELVETEEVTLIRNVIRKLVAELVTSEESMLRRMALVRLRGETVTVQSFRRRINAIKRFVSERIDSTETLYKAWMKYVSESINIQKTGQAFQDLFQNNVFQIGKEFHKLQTLGRFADETVALVESQIRRLTFKRVISSIVNIPETRLRRLVFLKVISMQLKRTRMICFTNLK